MGIGHLEGISHELDGVADEILNEDLDQESIDKKLDEIKNECSHKRVKLGIEELKKTLKTINGADEKWSAIRAFTETMPCDCGECTNVLTSYIEAEDYETANELIQELRRDID